MAPNPPLGVLLHAIGGLMSAIFYLPYRKVKFWAWESYWIVGGVFSWIVAPWIIAFIAVPNLLTTLSHAPAKSVFWSYFFGVLWGIGGLTFGLTVRYLGFALGTAMALGYCAAFGTLLPPVFNGEFAGVIKTTSGLVVMGGVLICLLGIAVSGMAGIAKERELPEKEKTSSVKEFSFKKGVWVATFCGIMSACMSYGFAAGKPIAALAVENGASDLWKNLPVLIVILIGGFTTNFLWCLALNIRNRTSGDYLRGTKPAASGGSPVERVPLAANYVLCAIAGTVWYLQFFFYGMGTTKMGRYDFSSWTLHMASIIIFGTLLGLFLAEWKGVSRRTHWLMRLGLVMLIASTVVIGIGNRMASAAPAPAEAGSKEEPKISGITGKISNVQIVVPAAEEIQPLATAQFPADVDLMRMAEWALNYLIETPRKNLGYEPVFQCHPLQCPPVPEGQDPVVACDTDARMDWEWYYMRDITGSKRGLDVEAAFHNRIRQYIDPEGRVWSHPGCFNEGNTTTNYAKKDYVIHIWGATKILKSLSEDYLRTKNPESKALAQKVMLALKKIATWDDQGRCWIRCGMGALHADGSIVPNGWNRQPAPIVEPLVTYWQATGDQEGLNFARAYADGMMNNLQPDGIKFEQDGKDIKGGFPFGAHSHATMHAVWGVAHLGVVTGETKYTQFAKNVWDGLLARGTGTGWFPAGPDNCNETCCVSDMISTATMIARSGHPEYFDFAERYLRNYISNLQFIMTPQFEAYYRQRNKNAGEGQVEKGLVELRKFQGGIIGGSGLNDFENDLLGNVSGFEMFGCCAPEGMRAIYTSWLNTIDHYDKSPIGEAGVYVNESLDRDSKWGRVISFFPEQGRTTVKAAVADKFFLRVPHWAPHDTVYAFSGIKRILTKWSGDYVRFDARPGDELTVTYPLVEFDHDVDGLWKNSAPQLHIGFHWRGNMVVSATPAPKSTPLFATAPRVLPNPPQ
jgi:L-rhamnose-H+ transport protein